ncbi:MAG: acyl carrier protein [Deltaproteobacteria bacterium]|nr:acyl carrier protein [Deltaproteobacteria bacterium]
MALEDELKAIIVEQLAVDEAAVVPNARLQDDLGADSLMLMALAELLAARYKISIEPDEVFDVPDVAGLVELVRSKLPA